MFVGSTDSALSLGALLSSFRSLRVPRHSNLQPTPAPSAAQTFAPSDDLGARTDALLKQCNDQLYMKGQFKEALESAEQAFQLSQNLGDKNRTVRALLYLGSALFYVGRSADALETMQNAGALARETGNKKGLSRALNNIAGIYGEMGRFEESLSYLHQCIDLARELGDPAMQHTALLNVGNLYVRLGDPDKAEAPLLESLRSAASLAHVRRANHRVGLVLSGTAEDHASLHAGIAEPDAPLTDSD